MLVQAASNRNTIVIDTGLSINQAENLLSAAESHVDFIKFGFGTAFFTGGFERKLALYRASGMDEVLSATNRRCPIKLLLAEMPAEIEADERLLQHIFTNVLGNAVKYSDPGRVVRFEVGCTGAEIVCTIRDQGIGIPEADREWLFSPFHRGRNVHDRLGTGLGLVIVKRCVDLHGGKIKWIASWVKEPW